MQDILTITLNPALDLSTAATKVSAGHKLRCAAPQRDPGGGGINVARAITELGGTARALVALGGGSGHSMATLLRREGVDFVSLEAPGETRISLAVTDQSKGEQYRFVLPGPDWSAADVSAALDLAAQAMPAEGLVVLSGSNPPGVPDDFAARLCRHMPRAQLIADTSGAALQALAAGHSCAPYVLRMDQVEAEGLAGHPLPSREDSAAFAADLVARGAAQVVVVARGADGSVLASADQRLHAMAADVPVVSKVGAGDSFVAGFTLALAQGCDLGTALQRGAASASAAVMTPATELCRREDAEALVAQCRLSDLA